MRPGDSFFSHFATGCGSTRLALTFEADGRARLCLSSRWMGSPPFDLRLLCRHVAADQGFGWLRVERLVAPAPGGGGGERALDLPELPFPPLLEYVARPPTALSLPPDADLADMRALGYAAWTDVWDVLTWVHPRFEPPTPENEGDELTEGAAALAQALGLLDKARFARDEGRAGP
jgi:hypothetical protein